MMGYIPNHDRSVEYRNYGQKCCQVIYTGLKMLTLKYEYLTIKTFFPENIDQEIT